MTTPRVHPMAAGLAGINTDWLIERENWAHQLVATGLVDRRQAVNMINNQARTLPRKLEGRDIDDMIGQILEIHAPLPHRTVSLARINHHWSNQ